MNDLILEILTFSSALGCGLVAGVFFAFSNFVMRALARLTPAGGIAAMQSINVTVITPLFMLALFGTGALCLAVTVLVFLSPPPFGGVYLVTGSIVYLFGTVVVTIAFNVPRNDALAAIDPSGAEAERVWSNYLTAWTAWNHVRTLAALVAAASFTVAFAVLQG